VLSSPEKKEVLIVVRTYPTPASAGVEVSCTAGVTRNGEWIRLFPVPYRFLKTDQRFTKYQWIEVSVRKPSSDVRPESYKIIGESIKILSDPLSSLSHWKARKEALYPLKSHCLCCLKKQRDMYGSPTLGLFKPKIHSLVIKKEKNESWTEEQLAKLNQRDLFGDAPKADLEKIPYKFQYDFSYDHEECPGHCFICTDWEIAQAWRGWKAKYGEGWEEKFRQKFETDMINKYDTHFFVGTLHGHPKIWIIIGLFYPMNMVQDTQELTLFP
jgi:hypothetical protein